MKRMSFKSKSLMFVIGMAIALVILPWIDMQVSQYFYNNGDFELRGSSLYTFWDWIVPAVLVVVSAGIFGLWMLGFWEHKKWILGVDTKVMLLTSGAMFLGTGLIVNGIFKTFWGRARPFDILEFGGSKIFTCPFVISNQCSWDCSFMSGHASIGFWTLSLALLVKGRFRPLAIFGSLLLGVAMGMTRIIQGNHFVSDVFFSGLVNVLLICCLYQYLYVEKKLK